MEFLRTVLPPWAYSRLIGGWNKEGFSKYAKNTWWMFVGRIALYPISLLVIASMARYLGPEGLGELTYAQSIIGIIATITALGIDQILVRDLVRYPTRAPEILGTALSIQLVTSCIAFIGTVSLFFFFEHNTERAWILFFMACTMLTGPFSIGTNLFTAQALSKYTTIITVSTRLSIALLKLLFVFLAVPLVWFAVLFLVESVLTLILTLYFSQRVFHNLLSSWHFSLSTLRQLIHDSWPLLISATSVYLFARIDQIMLQHYMGIEQVGLYGATVQFTDTWTFIPTIIIGSLYPAVAGMYVTDHKEYTRRMKLLTLIALTTACGIGAVIICAAPLIISIVYGSAFLGAISILQVYTLYVPIAVAYAIVQNHLITANRTKTMLLIGVVGAIVNIVLNLFLIPIAGALGAVIATIVAGSIMVGIPFITRRRASIHD